MTTKAVSPRPRVPSNSAQVHVTQSGTPSPHSTINNRGGVRGGACGDDAIAVGTGRQADLFPSHARVCRRESLQSWLLRVCVVSLAWPRRDTSMLSTFTCGVSEHSAERCAQGWLGNR